MFSFSEIFASVADVWIVWFVCAAALAYLTRSMFLARRRVSARALASGERGGSYVLSVVLVAPVYTLLICLIAECTLMLVVKMGTLYAAYSSARSAVVWLPSEAPQATRSNQVRLAAVQAMTPFASGHTAHVMPGFGSRLIDDVVYYQAYLRYSGGRAPAAYLARKREYAAAATRVSPEFANRRVNRGGGQTLAVRDVSVTVIYQMPINIPGVGRFLGQGTSFSGGRFFSRPIASSVTLEMETPQSASGRLGIRYDSLN